MKITRLNDFVVEKFFPLSSKKLFLYSFSSLYLLFLAISLLAFKFDKIIPLIIIALSGACDAQITLTVRIGRRCYRFNEILDDARLKADEAKTVSELNEIWVSTESLLKEVSDTEDVETIKRFRDRIRNLQSEIRIEELHTAEEMVDKIKEVIDQTWLVNKETGEAIFEIKKIIGWNIPEGD